VDQLRAVAHLHRSGALPPRCAILIFILIRRSHTHAAVEMLGGFDIDVAVKPHFLSGRCNNRIPLHLGSLTWRCGIRAVVVTRIGSELNRQGNHVFLNGRSEFSRDAGVSLRTHRLKKRETERHVIESVLEGTCTKQALPQRPHTQLSPEIKGIGSLGRKLHQRRDQQRDQRGVLESRSQIHSGERKLSASHEDVCTLDFRPTGKPPSDTRDEMINISTIMEDIFFRAVTSLRSLRAQPAVW
jgi:hypothetical protein